MAHPVPNFLYIGTSKAGSTWLYDVVNRHPEIHMAPGKGLYFFSQHYERGLDWYTAHFAGGAGERIVGEVCHAYLYDPRAGKRIAEMSVDTRLMVCLREPVERAFSEYQDARKNGKLETSFEVAIQQDAELLERGRYAKYLSSFLEHFPRNQVHVALFDDLVEDPDAFAAGVFRFLGVEPLPLTQAQRSRMLPAGVPRSRQVATLAKRGAHLMHRLGLRGIRGRLKTSRRVRNALYRPLDDSERPTMDPDTQSRLRTAFESEVKQLDVLIGGNLSSRWGYDK